jgi:hypothetical protein
MAEKTGDRPAPGVSLRPEGTDDEGSAKRGAGP